ncbi:MAG: ATP synthase F0 subunit B [Deltaproteobacteria bacterium]|nr:ATP synthase F0 subunit B [Deltaproteobacteria bacterium]
MDFLGNIEIITNPSGLITVNETLFVQIFSFLIFLFIINRVMFRPLRNTMAKRDRYLEDIKKDIDNADMDLQNVTNLIKKGELAIKKESQEMRKKLEDSGKQTAAEQIEASREEIAKLKETAENQIKGQIEDAREQIKTEFDILSVTIMEKILDRRMAS